MSKSILPERWLSVVGLGRMGREVLNEFCSEINPRETQAEFFYFDKSSEIEKMRKNGSLRINNLYSLEELEKIEIPQLKNAVGTIFVAGLGGFKTGASALVNFGRDMTTYYRSYPQVYGQSSVALVSLPFEFEGKEMREKALEALEEVKKSVDFTIIVDYNKIPWEELTVRKAFERANILTSRILKSIILPLTLGWEIICLDWLDFVVPFKCSTGRKVCVGVGKPKEDGIEALESALDNPLYDAGIDMRKAEAYFLSGMVGEDIPFSEVERTIDYFAKKYASREREPLIIFGCYLGNELGRLAWTVFVPVDTCLDI
ncbi:cell division protein FtsZ [Hydrogenivirga sp. 128-5-R1-1]|uniref:cell division protein FtsZ n=1 Tax=Hydrogenivirga sp. 128-5-R1-1 TaxID=392423 RepID=UPI00015F3714|nr:cell division protein FtsZ [Hydrogenivirga sp. 128-5-R1-1]EDP76306.1 cell division protein FtsZ [Hydrogenivirga sp. 128-5-R1-1]